MDGPADQPPDLPEGGRARRARHRGRRRRGRRRWARPLLGARRGGDHRRCRWSPPTATSRVPGREDDPLYIFGFVPVDPTAVGRQLIATYKGHAQHIGADPRLPAERRHQDHADQPRAWSSGPT